MLVRPIASWRIAARLAVCLALVAGAAAESAPDLKAATDAGAAAAPPAAFFGRPKIEEAHLSPSGRWLALLVPTLAGRNALAVVDPALPESVKVIASSSDFDIGAVHWVNEDWLVFSVVDHKVGQGDRQNWPGLYAIGRNGEGLRQLVQLRRYGVTEIRVAQQRVLAPNHVLLHVPGGDGTDVVVGEYQFSERYVVSAVIPKRLNVVSGRVSALALGTPPNPVQWLFDPDGTPRVVVTADEGKVRVLRREEKTGVWKLLAEMPRFRQQWYPLQLDADGQLYGVAHAGKAGEAVLKRFVLDTGKLATDSLVDTPGFDFIGRLISETDGSKTLGVRVVTDAETTVWLDPGMKAIQADIDRRLPGRINQLQCRACESATPTVLVRSWSDRMPDEYHLWRAKPAADGAAAPLAEAQLIRIGSTRPDIDPRRMASTDFHRIKARDGLELPVWVTTPAQARPGERLPTVVLVHGGPWVRGGLWRWEADRQFLAAQGYLVVEPEFRGSQGYGARHLEAGMKQWGQKMQDDVADATRWAADKQGADPNRVCIAGASYGGYSTLMGLVRDPDLYRCGVAWVAVTEPRLMYEWSFSSDSNEAWRRYGLPELVGDLKADAAMLEAASPLAQAARIKRPLLLAFGESDVRVPLEHGTRLREALRAAGNDPQWISYPSEGHGFHVVANRIDFAERMARFLAENLR